MLNSTTGVVCVMYSLFAIISFIIGALLWPSLSIHGLSTAKNHQLLNGGWVV